MRRPSLARCRDGRLLAAEAIPRFTRAIAAVGAGCSRHRVAPAGAASRRPAPPVAAGNRFTPAATRNVVGTFQSSCRSTRLTGRSRQSKGPLRAGLCFSSVGRLGGESAAIPLPVESVPSANGGRVGLGAGSGWLPVFALVRCPY